MLLVQSIQITDKFGFDKQTAERPRSSSETVFLAADPAAFCINGLGKFLHLLFISTRRAEFLNNFYLFVYRAGVIVAGTVFLLAQLAVVAIWTYLWQRRRKVRSIDNCSSAYGPSMQTQTLPSSRADSLSKLYDYEHSIASRHGHQF